MGETLNLRNLVRGVIRDDVGPDPRDIATKVLEVVPFGDERDYLAFLLPAYCREVSRSLRSGYIHNTEDGETRSSSGDVGKKWADVRGVFGLPFCVDGEWLKLGGLSQDQVVSLAGDYSRLASDNQFQSERFLSLRNLMRRHKARVVSDLPVEKVEGVMS